ncbi:hypothetical protein GCM10008995_29140 [Halobellus salinus]|uniref:Uncharacterized protein n=1 Tax=Halobellus salinus TaxID=931585 RepID=A0A830ESI8_9EURY|nr:hypothetical protein [Halobellus salinus]GGJ17554.1 hypothetical protein GCM10008995_29140 [Halobellus salinus]SMP35518.1 hypothetical protein SAMN06265347_1318 [Halobellus salinus]
MPNKSKRELEREIDRLEPDRGDAGVGLIIDLRENEYTTREEAPRPELTVRDPDRDVYHIPIPHVPHTGHKAILTVSEDVRETWPDTGDPAPTVAELWDELTPSDLQREKEIREQNGDPIPPILTDE